MNEILNRHDQTAKRQELRREMPPAERKLWGYLHNEQLGAKFRRQFSIGRYVLDFYCPRLRLAIEIDGESHTGDEAQAYDALRQREIEALGIVFLRFSNLEVYGNVQGVAETIRLKVEELRTHSVTPSNPTLSGRCPSPPPRGEERTETGGNRRRANPAANKGAALPLSEGEMGNAQRGSDFHQ